MHCAFLPEWFHEEISPKYPVFRCFMSVLSQREKSLFSVSFAKKLPKIDHKTESIQLHIQKQFLHFCTSENARCYKTHTNTVQTKAEFRHDAISKDGTTREIKKKGGEDYKRTHLCHHSAQSLSVWWLLCF